MTNCQSMTGFAARGGNCCDHDWQWEVRSVNGKGLDLRLRTPDIAGLEGAVRTALGRVASRGNVTISLRINRAEAADALRISNLGLTAALNAIVTAVAVAQDRGITLTAPTAVEVLGMRGVIEHAPAAQETPHAVIDALLADLDALLADFARMRRAEGAHLGTVITRQIDRIEELVHAAQDAADARRPEAEAALHAALNRIPQSPGMDPQRIAQELALLAVRADVTEELDRLRAHIAAARALLDDTAPVGRKFEFLLQEFVREANTLCSKSGSTALTAIGLDLKQVIDQMREQVQNVE